MKSLKFTAIILLLCLLCSCSNSPSDGTSSNSPDNSETAVETLNMYAIRENDLNPLLTVSESGRQLLYLVFRPLVTVGQNFDYSCILAETISPSADCSVYSVRLRQDVKWHDGSDFTSADVDYTISKIFEYAESSPYFENLENVNDCYRDGAYGYTFLLEDSDSGFPSLLNFPIVKNGSLDKKVSTVGTGEYRLTEYKQFTSFTLESENGRCIKVSLLPDSQSAASSFKLGKIDLLKITSTDESSHLSNNSKNYISSNTNKYTFISVNHNRTILSAPSLRRIIAKILSADAVINDLVPEYAVRADSFVNPSAYFATQNTAEYGDIKQALEELGYIPDQSGVRVKEISGTERTLSFSMLVNSDNPSRVIAAEYIANLLGSYGFKVSVAKTDFETYCQALSSGDFDLALCETDISLNNDYTFLIGTDGKMNFGRYSSESADNLLSAISTCSDKTRRVELLTELQSLFYTDMPHIPLWFSTSKIISKEKLPETVSIGGLSDELSTISSWERE